MTRQTSEVHQVNVQAGKVDAFGERVSIAIEKVGGSTKMAEIADVSTSVLSKWRRGESDPSRSRLVKMARAAGVTVEWLATGEGPMISGQEATEPARQYHATAAATAYLDELEEVVSKIRRMFRERGINLKPEAEARIVRLVYEYYLRQGEAMDEASLDNVIELAAFR